MSDVTRVIDAAAAGAPTGAATLRDENPAFVQIGLFREASDVPEAIALDHVTESAALEDVSPRRPRGSGP